MFQASSPDKREISLQHQRRCMHDALCPSPSAQPDIEAPPAAKVATEVHEEDSKS